LKDSVIIVMGSMGPTVDFDAPGDTVLSPSVLAHVVLRTQKLKEMVDFYTTYVLPQAST
jgi:hypothetical protein